MNKKTSSTIGPLILAAALSYAAFPATAIAGNDISTASNKDVLGVSPSIAEGVFEENQSASWKLDSEGCLHIEGSGATCEEAEIRLLYEKTSSIVIGKDITAIGSGTFSFLNGASKATFENGSSCSSIGNRAFYDCESLKSISIPPTVTSIGCGAFESCWSLKRIDFGSGDSQLTSIGASAFNGCEDIEEVELPSGLETIGDYAFTACTSLESVSIPATVTSIGRGAFENCANLKTVKFENGSKARIASNAFAGIDKDAPGKTKPPKIKYIKPHGKHKLAVKWTSCLGAKSYQVHYKQAGQKRYKHTDCKGSAKRRVILKNLNKGKRYKIYISAKAGGQTISKSKVKKSPPVK